MTGVITSVVSILLLIVLGFIIRHKDWLSQPAVDGIKRLVISFSLPCVLFTTFLNMELKASDFLIMIATIGMLLLFYAVARLMTKHPALSDPIVPFLSTGYCFGLLGIPLFGAVFGAENLGKITLFGVGHEVFMWLIYFNLFKQTFSEERFSTSTFMGFFKSPILMSIFLGVAMNLAGLDSLFTDYALMAGIMKGILSIASLATPLILILIGYGTRIDMAYLRPCLKYIMVRLSMMLLVGYSYKMLVIDRLTTGGTLFEYAFFTLLILPTPYSLPIFAGEYSSTHHKDLTNNMAVISTLVTLVIFIPFVLIVAS